MSHPSVTQVKTALATAIKTTGLRMQAEGAVTGTIECPAAAVVPGTFIPGETEPAIKYDSTMANGAHEYLFTIITMVSNTVDRQAQANTDDYISPEGSKSIKAAIESDMSLGGVVSYARVTKVIQYGTLDWNGLKYFGAQLVVEVVA